jgi:hypothetical protein
MKYCTLRLILLALYFAITTSACAEQPDTADISASISLEYEIYDTVYKDAYSDEFRDVNIQYPKLRPSERFVGADKINELILEAAKFNYLRFEDRFGLWIEQTYELARADEDYISIIFKAKTYVMGLAHPSDDCYAVTIDIRKQQICGLESFISDYEYIKNKLRKECYDVENGEIQVLNTDQIIFRLENGYFQTEISEHVQDFFLDGDRGLGLIMYVGSGAGYYSLVKLNSED